MSKKILIIGGGPGGYVAAIRASQLGAEVTLVEKDELGGTCLNRGCIPTKALYKNAEIVNTMKIIGDFGIETGSFDIDMSKVQSRKDEVVHKMRTGIEQLMKGYKINVIKAAATFKDNKTVQLKTADGSQQEVRADAVIIATGSVSAPAAEPGMELPGVITSDDALSLDHIPKSMVVYGGGVVGVEFASIFASLGTDVTIIKYRPRLIRSLDEEISKHLAVYLRKKKIKVNVGVKVTHVEKTGAGLKVVAETEKGPVEYECENLLLAVGRMPNTGGLNLEAAGVAYSKRGITVNDDYETNVPGIYAIGDVIGGQMLAHVASEEGKVCVERIMGHDAHLSYGAVPSCVFSFPEVAVVGKTEEEAKEEGINYAVGKANFAANGKAMTLREAEGFVKVIADLESRKILGVHIIGPHASDLIHEGVLAVEKKMTVDDIKDTIHAHPTLGEAFYEATLGCVGESVHSLPKK